MDYLQLCRDAYESSTSYFDANFRKQIEDNMRMFQSKHPKDSKYLSDAYKHRSKIFRPKTRSAVRKNEAAAAAAFFANTDVVSTDAVNPSDPKQLAAAELMKWVLNERLTKSVPWFQVLVGGVQDAQVQGVVASYQYWKYKEVARTVKSPILDMNNMPIVGEDGNPLEQETQVKEVIEDKPCIELLPIENIRIDPAADWLDPIASSPYVIRLIPMYVIDVKRMMEKADPKTGMPKWKKLTDDQIRQAQGEYDSTRQTRNKENEEPETSDKPLTAYEVVFVHENFFREEDGVKVVYSMGTAHLLTDAVDLKEIYFHGEIPIVMGVGVIETHRPIPSAYIELGGEIQREFNDVANSRLDNVKLALNKRFVVKRGAQVDLQSLVKNAAGSVTMATNPIEDVREMEFNDVTGSSYMEQDRLNVDFDELMGNFSSGSVQTNRKLNETVGGMGLIASGANQMTEYLLRTITETWIEKVLRQLVKLEQAYETDELVLAIAGNKAQLWQKYGISKVTDDLLNQSLTLTVNVGMGATDPAKRLQNFVMGAKTCAEITRIAPDMDSAEVRKEIFSLLGYRDGARFFKGAQLPPEVKQKIEQMQQQFQQLQQQLAQAQQALKDKSAELQMEQQRMVAEFGLEQQKSQREAQLELEKLALERQVKDAELALKKYQIDQEAKLKRETARENVKTERMHSQMNMEGMVSTIADHLNGMRQELRGQRPVA